MKKIYGFAALCAAMTLASCSNNDEPIVNGGGQIAKEIGGYVSVNIANAKSTRAGHNNFEYGTDAESKATKATFIFCKSNGDKVTVMDDRALTFTSTPENDGENVERNYNVLVPVEVTGEGLTKDTQEGRDKIKEVINDIDNVIVILNPTDAINSAVKADACTNASNVLAIVADYSATTPNNDLVMSNSVYYDTTNDKAVYSTNVSGNIRESELVATQHPVNIYVERVVSRIDLINSEAGIATNPINQFKIYEYDENGVLEESTKTLAINVKGIELGNVANQSYLIKKVENYGTLAVSFDDWNDVGNLRSHWATSWTLGSDATAPNRLASVDGVAVDQTKLGFLNKNYSSFADFLNNDETKTLYINENTNEKYGTTVMVSAEIGTKEGNVFTPMTIYRSCYDGRYYSEDAIYNSLLGRLQREGYGVAIEDEEGNVISSTPLTRNDLEFASAVSTATLDATDKVYHGFTGYLEFKEGKDNQKIVKTVNGGVTYTEITDFVDVVLHSDAYKTWRWQDGKCYYYVYLTNKEAQYKYDKDGVAATEGTEFDDLRGIVRNHIYKVDLKSISGLGVPVFDANDIIVPETPEKIEVLDNWNLGCNIHILSWGSYSQEAEFGQGQDY